MNKERLLNVARALRESPDPDNFSMDNYISVCGTPACALGHYALRRDLQDTFKGGSGRHRSFVVLVTPRDGEDLTDDEARDVDYDDQEVADHFGITSEQCRKLFSAYGCACAKTTEDAAKYIEDFTQNEDAS